MRENTVQKSLHVRRAVQTFRRAFTLRIASQFRAALEAPEHGISRRSAIEVRGWAISSREEFVSGHITLMLGRTGGLDDAMRLPLELTEERPDVIGFFGMKSWKNKVGFSTKIPWSIIPNGVDVVRLSVNVTNGVEFIALGPVTVYRAQEQAPTGRENYKGVWNSAADSHDAAMIAVAGFSDFEAFMESGRSTAQTLKQRLQIVPSDVVLEIGCGTGRIGASLAGDCRQWIGTDISGRMLRYAEENLKRAGRTNYTLQELPDCVLAGIADGSVDKLYSSAVFMHLDEWDRYRYVREAFRVLKPGGKAYFDNLNIESDEGWKIFEELAALDPTERPLNISKMSTEPELVTYLTKAGFQNITTYRSGRFIEIIGDR